MFVHAGDPAAGQAAISPFRAVATPYGEAAMPMPYPGIYEFTAEGGTRQASTTRSLFMDTLDDDSVDAILSALEVAPPASMVQLRVLGGAMGRVPAGATAFAHRGASVMVAIINGFVVPELVETATAWNRSLFGELEPKATGVYANFLEDEGDARIRVAYPDGTYDRLARIKRRYDPANVSTATRTSGGRADSGSSNGSGPARSRAVRHGGDGAGDEIRTRDIHLGKVALCQLSYSREGSVRDDTSALGDMPRRREVPPGVVVAARCRVSG